MKLLFNQVWNKVKEFFKSDLERDIERINGIIAENKVKYREQLKTMTDRELMEEICFQLRF